MFDEIFEANARYASAFDLAGMQAPAAKGFCLLTCMDTRIDPLAILGLSPGDAKILRNAAGRVTPDVLRSLVLATNFLAVSSVAVMHHTKCALAGTDDSKVTAALPEDRRHQVSGWSFLSMPDPEAALAEDVAALRSCPALPPDLVVEGWRYDVDTGTVSRVIPA